MIVDDKISKIENFYENIMTKFIELKVSTKYIKYLNNLNYNVKLNDIIIIPIKHLPFGSGKKILVKCEKCSNIIESTFNNYVNIMKKGNNYKCKNCNTFENNNIRLYGVKNSMELNIFRDKIKKTKLEKYNDENYNNKEKSKKTSLDKYGYEYFSNTDLYKKKYKNTCLEKYNVDNVSKIQSVKDKKKSTLRLNYNIDSLLSLKYIQDKKNITVKNKYNVDNVFQLDWVKEKSKKTMLKKYGVEKAFLLPNKRYKILFDERFELYYQGTYEKDFLNFCFNNNIKISKPKYIKYIFNEKEYKYFPDYYINALNLLIEIKSDYTFEVQKEKNIAKQNYSIKNGFKHIFIINKNYKDLIKRIHENV